MSLSLVAAATLAGGCGSGAHPQAAGSQPPAGCDEVAREAADLAVAAADHAAATGGGIPASAGAVEHPDEMGSWDLLASLAAGSDDLLSRIDAAGDADQRLDCPADVVHETVESRVRDELEDRRPELEGDLGREAYAAITFMAIATDSFRPPASGHAVPDGFPAEFPVHPDAAEVDSSVTEDGEATATWVVAGGDWEEVSGFYRDALQEGRLGGWNVPSVSAESTDDGDGNVIGSEQLVVEGYGFAGEVDITRDGPDRVTITARLAPQG